MKTICTGMFTIMLVLLFRPVGAQTEDAFPSYIEQCFNNYNPQIEMFARFKMKSSFHKTKRII